MTISLGPRFCCKCINDSDGRAKTYVGDTDDQGQAIPVYRWVCDDAEACAAEEAQSRTTWRKSK